MLIIGWSVSLSLRKDLTQNISHTFVLGLLQQNTFQDATSLWNFIFFQGKQKQKYLLRQTL